MAKFFYVTAVALLCLFTLSLARTPSENDDVSTATSLPISESTAAVRVRSEAANAETESDSAALTTVPLTRITFRPVNRRFDVRSKRPCRHHSRFNNPRMKEIPYGNDMIVASGENSDFEDPVIHGGGRRTSGRWVRLHHHHHHSDEDSDSDDDDDRMKKMVFKRYDHHGKFDTEKQLKALKEMRKRFRHESEEEEEKHKKGTGFMRRVRKFLDNYF